MATVYVLIAVAALYIAGPVVVALALLRLESCVLRREMAA